MGMERLSERATYPFFLKSTLIQLIQLKCLHGDLAMEDIKDGTFYSSFPCGSESQTLMN